MDKTGLTVKTYDKIALDYEKRHLRFKGTEELIKFVELLKPGGKVLDAGCGFGRDLLYFLDKGFDSYGIDASSELMKLAKKRAPKANIKLVDLRNKFPFKDNFFDGVWARNSLHHLEPKSIKFTLSEIKRVLKPKGILFIEWKEGEEETITREEVAEGNERYYNLMPNSRLVQLVKESGFKIIENYSFDWTKRYKEKREFASFIAIFSTKP